MIIQITDFKNTVGHSKEKSNIKTMADYLNNCLKEFGVCTTSATLDADNKSLRISGSASEKKLFVSIDENIIKLAPGDKRIKGDGRDYLKSKFLTKKQFILLQRTLVNCFKAIGVDCVVTLHENPEDMKSSILLVDTEKGVNNIQKLVLIQKTFPQERVKDESTKKPVKK